MSKFKVNSNKKTRLYRLSVSYPDLRTWTESKREEEPGPSLWSQFVLVHWLLMSLFNIPWSHQPDSLKLVEAVLLIERPHFQWQTSGQSGHAWAQCLSWVWWLGSLTDLLLGRPKLDLMVYHHFHEILNTFSSGCPFSFCICFQACLGKTNWI